MVDVEVVVAATVVVMVVVVAVVCVGHVEGGLVVAPNTQPALHCLGMSAQVQLLALWHLPHMPKSSVPTFSVQPEYPVRSHLAAKLLLGECTVRPWSWRMRQAVPQESCRLHESLLPWLTVPARKARQRSRVAAVGVTVVAVVVLASVVAKITVVVDVAVARVVVEVSQHCDSRSDRGAGGGGRGGCWFEDCMPATTLRRGRPAFRVGAARVHTQGGAEDDAHERTGPFCLGTIRCCRSALHPRA